MARAVEEVVDLAVVTDDNPRREDPGRIRRDVVRGFGCLDNVVLEADRARAIHWALEQAAPGDCVLIAGKGHEETQTIGTVRHWFDDREIARRWLYEHLVVPAEIIPMRRRAKAG
jgi:UDP-N-acetylmuramoyl-L-alanyl-D-glutamate--2,6-diaminopimelate ligase